MSEGPVVPEVANTVGKNVENVSVASQEERPPLIPEAGEQTTQQKITDSSYRDQEKLDSIREQLDEEKNPYSQSTLVDRLKNEQSLGRQPKIAFLDLDSTLSGNPQEALEVRKLLEEQGYGVAFVTSRTEEMVMSRQSFEASDGIDRPAPHLGEEAGRRVQAFADETPDFAGLYDPDIIAATTGSQILVKEKSGGYQKDQEFVEKTKNVNGDWRQKTEQIIAMIDPSQALGKLAPIEDPASFEAGQTDVYPPDTRIQVNFELGASSVAESTGSTEKGGLVTHEDGRVMQAMKEEYGARIRGLSTDKNLPKELRDHIANLRITDDSNPEKGRYAVYLTPNKGYKSRAVEEIVNKTATELGIDKKGMKTLMVGDSFPDISMGLYGGTGTDSTFLIVGGSRLTDVFTNSDNNEFAGEGMNAVSTRLFSKGKGEMGFVAPLIGERKVIVGDQAYPGTKGPSTIRAYLEDQAKSVK